MENRKQDFYTETSIKEINQHLNQTRSQRIRAALFPETLDDGGTNERMQYSKSTLNTKPTAVQRLSTPSQLLKTAVLNLINYQDDADATLKAIPELLKLLNDDDRMVCVKTIGIIEQLAKKDASRHALVNSQNLIAALVGLINNCSDIEVLRIASSALYNMCCNQNGLQMLFKSGGIPALIKLLGSPIDNVVRYALSTLHNLLIYEDSAKAQVRKFGGIQRFVLLLGTQNAAKVLTIILDCLHILTYNNAEAKLIVASNGAPKDLVRILKQTNYEKLIWTTIRLMKVLSICATNKAQLIKHGAIHVLAEHLERPISSRIILNSLIAIRNLSDSAIREDNMDGLIKKLIEYLSSNTDMNISICSAGILSNLTCNNDLNKIKFVEYNGIEALVRTIVQSSENFEEIYEPAVCSLRHVTNRHSQAYKAQEAIRYNYGLPVIAQILKSDENRWPLLKATIGLTRNLALSENNLTSLRELGIIPRLVQLLIRAVNIYQQNRNINNAVIDDVPMDEIIEGTVAALHQLSRDTNNRHIIRELKCIPLMVQLLYMPKEHIQKVACGCLCELANEKDFAELIENENPTEKLTELLRSKDEILATYAAAVLFRLSENKPQHRQNENQGDKTYAPISSVQQQNGINNYKQYDLEMQQASVNDTTLSYRTNNQPRNQQQNPSSWFDTDL